MLINTTILALALALAPTIPTDRTPFDVSDAEFVTGDDSAHLLAYDSDGEVSAEIVLWYDDDDRTRLDVMFADGLYQSTTIDGENVTTETDDAAEVAERLAVLETSLPSLADIEPETAAYCAASLIGVAGACGAARPLLCISVSLTAGLNCGNLLEEALE